MTCSRLLFRIRSLLRIGLRFDGYIHFFACLKLNPLPLVIGQNIFDPDFSIQVFGFVNFDLRLLGVPGDTRLDYFLYGAPQFFALLCHQVWL